MSGIALAVDQIADPTALVPAVDAMASVGDGIDSTLPGSTDSGSIEGRARAALEAAGGPVQYALVFVLAAIPLLEVLVVIPIGVAVGLDPVAVAVVAFAGNALGVYAVIAGSDRLRRWRATPDPETESKRRRRAKRVWRRYGLPGLAVLGPIATGVHLAAAIAVGLGARRSATVVWMTLGIAVWTVLITAATVAGVAVVS